MQLLRPLLLFFFALLASFLLVSPANSAPSEWSVDTIPDPYTDYRACGRDKPSNVCDPDRILPNEAERDKIQFLLTQIALLPQQAHCTNPPPASKPFHGALLLVNKIQIPPNTHKIDAINLLAQQVGDKWRISDPHCQNGFILALSLQDRVVYLKTAAQLRERVSDDRAEWITDLMKPYLKNGQVAKALHVALDTLKRSIADEPVDFDNGDDDNSDWIFLLIFFGGLFLLIAGHALYDRYKRRQSAERAQRALNGILTDLQRANLDNLGTAPATRDQIQRNQTCPICLEQFEGEEDDHVDRTGRPKSTRKHTDLHSNNCGGQDGYVHMRKRPCGGAESFYVAAAAEPDDSASNQVCSTAVMQHENEQPLEPERLSPTTAAVNEDQDADVRALRCGHCYHGSCISEWLREHTQCPLCRAEVSQQDGTGQQQQEQQQEEEADAERLHRNRAAFYRDRFRVLFPDIVTALGGAHVLDDMFTRPGRSQVDVGVEDHRQSAYPARPWEPSYERVENLWARLDFSAVNETLRGLDVGRTRHSSSSSRGGGFSGGGFSGGGGGGFSGGGFSGGGGGGSSW